MADLRSEITVTVKDRDAQKSLDDMIRKLERARELATSLGLTGADAAAAAGGVGRPGGPAPAPSPSAGSPSAEDHDPSARIAGGKGARYQALMERELKKATQTLIGGANNPAFSIQLFGRALTGLTSTLNKGLMDLIKEGSDLLESIPFAGAISTFLGAGAMAGHIGTMLMTEATTSRFSRVMNLANLERPMAQARVTGGFDGGINNPAFAEGARLGFRPQEVAQMLGSFSRSIGQAGGGTTAFNAGVNPFQAALSGMSPEMLARFISTGSLGGGAVGGVGAASSAVLGLTGTMERQGLRGAKLDEALARVTSATTQLSETGITVDLANVNQTIADISATGGGLGGMQAVRTAVKLTQAGPQAASQFGGQFGGLIGTAIQAHAFSQASNPIEAMQIMQDLAKDPRKVQEIVSQQLGPEAAAMAFAGGGFVGASDAERFAGGLARGQVTPGLGGATPGDVPLSGMMSGHELELMREVSGDMATNKAILGAMQKIEKTLINLSAEAGPYLRGVDSMLRSMTGT